LVPTFIGIKDNAAAAYPLVHLTALIPSMVSSEKVAAEIDGRHGRRDDSR
jgi:hypothetical protein